MSVQTYCNRTKAIRIADNCVWKEGWQNERSSNIKYHDTQDAAINDFNTRVRRIARHITNEDIRR